MTTDCSLNHQLSTRKFQAQNTVRTCCVHKLFFLFLFWYSEQFMYTTCSELAVFMYWTGNSLNNLLSYCGLVDARISASENNIPVLFALYWTRYKAASVSIGFCSIFVWFLLTFSEPIYEYKITGNDSWLHKINNLFDLNVIQQVFTALLRSELLSY